MRRETRDESGGVRPGDVRRERGRETRETRRRPPVSRLLVSCLRSRLASHVSRPASPASRARPGTESAVSAHPRRLGCLGGLGGPVLALEAKRSVPECHQVGRSQAHVGGSSAASFEWGVQVEWQRGTTGTTKTTVTGLTLRRSSEESTHARFLSTRLWAGSPSQPPGPAPPPLDSTPGWPRAKLALGSCPPPQSLAPYGPIWYNLDKTSTF